MKSPLPDTQTVQPADALARSIYRLTAVQRSLARIALPELGPHGFLILGTIAKHGPARVSEIASRLRVDLSVASRQVSALEADGLLERQADPADGRAQQVTLTDEGAARLADAHQKTVAALERAVAGWTPEEIAALSSALDRLREDFCSSAAQETPEEHR